MANNIYKKLDYLFISLIKKIENKSNEKGEIIKDVSRIKREISINKTKKIK
jgi:hypothetical protein